MKKIFLLAATVFTLVAFQSCSKCGHCEREQTDTIGGASTTTKVKDGIYCGNDGNESGSYRKAAELECKAWAGKQTTVTGRTYSSTWVTDK